MPIQINIKFRKLEDVEFIFAGIHVCFDAWKTIYGFKKGTVERAWCYVKKGLSMVPSCTKKRHAPKNNNTLAWMEVFFSRYGEHMPFKGEIHLPCWLNREKVYAMMVEELTTRNDIFLKYDRFCRIWRSHFDHVKIPKVTISYNQIENPT